jgi:hypothetical protein
VNRKTLRTCFKPRTPRGPYSGLSSWAFVVLGMARHEIRVFLEEEEDV